MAQLLSIKKYINDDMISSLKKILGTNFFKLREFYEEQFFLFKRNTCTVLVTRRSFLMAMWYLGYFSKQETIERDYDLVMLNSCFCIRHKESGRVNYIISDKGISLINLLPEIEDIFILDDICIHGRQLENLKWDICDNNNIYENRVKKLVFMKSEESIVKEVDYAKVNIRNGQWVMPSQRIVEAINYLLLPYVSYINSYIKANVSVDENDQFLDTLFQNSNLIVKAFGRDNRLQLGKQSFYIIEKSQIDNDKENLSCVRYYYNFETNIASFIPYVIVQPINEQLNKQQLQTLLSNYLKDNITTKLIKEIDLLYRNDFRNCKGFIYNLLSCVASYQYGIYFAKKYLTGKFNFIVTNNLWDLDVTDSITLAFGEKIANLILNGNNYKEKTLSQDKLLDAKLDLLDLKSYVDDYTVKRWAERENAAMNLDDEPMKIELTSLFSENITNSYSVENRRLWAHSYLCDVISSCDNGRLNIASTTEKGDSFLEVGELGVITVREAKSKTKEIQNNLQKLLRKDYYYYILC